MDEAVWAQAERQAEICRVFANPRRVLIAWVLADQEKSVSEIAEMVGISLQNTSQHLQLMRERGILDSRREAQTIFYRMAPNEWAHSCIVLAKACQAA